MCHLGYRIWLQKPDILESLNYEPNDLNDKSKLTQRPTDKALPFSDFLKSLKPKNIKILKQINRNKLKI